MLVPEIKIITLKGIKLVTLIRQIIVEKTKLCAIRGYLEKKIRNGFEIHLYFLHC